MLITQLVIIGAITVISYVYYNVVVLSKIYRHKYACAVELEKQFIFKFNCIYYFESPPVFIKP